ncbi:hypothetical protein PFISCL1PPCAC_17751, partial [Pristionchus fissidentatus]
MVNTTIYYICCSNKIKFCFFQPPQLTLKSLPKENVYRILSNLGVRDRKRVRRCSKNMREAVQQSDLSVDLVMIIFNEGRSIFVKVVRGGFSSGDAVLKLIDAESFQIWLNTMKLKYFFRRLKCDRLLIQTEGMSTLVVEPMLIQMTEQLDFKELHLQFFSRLQPSIINFVQRLTKSVHSITTERFLPNLLEIIELPWASCLTVYDVMTQGGFSDQQVLQLAKQGRRYLSLPANLSDPTTLQCLIEIVHSTRMRCVSITVAEDYFHRFLSSIDLKEEGSQF